MERFTAIPATVEEMDRISALSSANPFLTSGYMAAQCRMGLSAWAFRCTDSNGISRATAAFIRSGRVGNILTIPSCPDVSHDSHFWKGLEDFVSSKRITSLELYTFAAPNVCPPRFVDERERVVRAEYLLDLQNPELLGAFSSTHRRWVKKGVQRKLTLRRSDSAMALDEHITLSDASTDRRRERGDDTQRSSLERDSLMALLEAGVGVIYQAVDGETPVSSLFALRAPSAGYLMSAGTSDGGRACGASHWLVSEVARTLRAEGLVQFNLGGARDEEAGLRAYKAAFGATPVEMESVIVRRGSRWRHTVIGTAALLRQYADSLRNSSPLSRRGS